MRRVGRMYALEHMLLGQDEAYTQKRRVLEGGKLDRIAGRVGFSLDRLCSLIPATPCLEQLMVRSASRYCDFGLSDDCNVVVKLGWPFENPSRGVSRKTPAE